MKNRILFLFILLFSSLPVSAGLVDRIDVIPETCKHLTEDVAKGDLGGEVRAFHTNETIPTFYSQCGYKRVEGPRRELQFTFKFLALERFDVDRMEPALLDFSVSFASGGLTHHYKEPYPGKMTYIFHDRNSTILFMITEVAGPPDGAGQETVLIATYRLTDGERTPEARQEVVKNYPWALLRDLIDR